MQRAKKTDANEIKTFNGAPIKAESDPVDINLLSSNQILKTLRERKPVMRYRSIYICIYVSSVTRAKTPPSAAEGERIR